MTDLFDEHFSRITDKLDDVYGVTNLAPWIEKHTFLDGKPFSFKDHEFQIPILADPAKTSIIVKCAQVGLSELAYRYAVAACCTQDSFSLIYIFPAAADAEKNCKTRIDPMISGSPELKRLVNPELNNSETKQFGSNSFLFFKGTRSTTQALSTPANALCFDEFDASDITQASVYNSRLQHKPHKIKKIFSTPTIDHYGVSKEAETAKRLRQICTCNHCNHSFLPDYFEHVKVPGWDKPLEEITKLNIHKIDWKSAVLLCPKCGKDPELHHTRQEFVCENPTENHEANAWYVTPFSVPNILTPAYLVNTSTKYEKFSEFKNQTLGLTAEEKNEQITLEDLEKALLQQDIASGELHAMGCDLGINCHIAIGRMTTDGTLLTVYREVVHYTKFEQRTQELAAKYRVTICVMDYQPYTELVTRITQARPNWWGAMFVNTKSPLVFTLKEQEEEAEEGKLHLRLTKINRTNMLDKLLDMLKKQEIIIRKQEDDAEFKKQMLSTKRVLNFNVRSGQHEATWVKTGDENDHMLFAMGYLLVACMMRGTVQGVGAVSAGVPLIRRFTNKQYRN